MPFLHVIIIIIIIIGFVYHPAILVSLSLFICNKSHCILSFSLAFILLNSISSYLLSPPSLSAYSFSLPILSFSFKQEYLSLSFHCHHSLPSHYTEWYNWFFFSLSHCLSLSLTLNLHFIFSLFNI